MPFISRCVGSQERVSQFVTVLACLSVVNLINRNRVYRYIFSWTKVGRCSANGSKLVEILTIQAGADAFS